MYRLHHILAYVMEDGISTVLYIYFYFFYSIRGLTGRAFRPHEGRREAHHQLATSSGANKTPTLPDHHSTSNPLTKMDGVSALVHPRDRDLRTEVIYKG